MDPFLFFLLSSRFSVLILKVILCSSRGWQADSCVACEKPHDDWDRLVLTIRIRDLHWLPSTLRDTNADARIEFRIPISLDARDCKSRQQPCLFKTTETLSSSNYFFDYSSINLRTQANKCVTMSPSTEMYSECIH